MFNGSIWPIDTWLQFSVDRSIFFLLFCLSFPISNKYQPKCNWLLTIWAIAHWSIANLFDSLFFPTFLMRNSLAIIIHLMMAFATILNQIRFLRFTIGDFSIKRNSIEKLKRKKINQSANCAKNQIQRMCRQFNIEPFTICHVSPMQWDSIFLFRASRTITMVLNSTVCGIETNIMYIHRFFYCSIFTFNTLKWFSFI